MQIMLLKQLMFSQPPKGLPEGLILEPGSVFEVEDTIGAKMVEIGEAVMVAEATAAEGSGEEVSGSETEDPAVGDAGAASGATSPLSTKKKR